MSGLVQPGFALPGFVLPGFVLAVDLGASGLRAALVDPAGTLHGRAGAGAAAALGDEADPEAWWRDLLHVAEAVAGAAGPDWARVAAVCVTGFTRTQVLLDAAGASVRPAITFRDTRAGAFGDPFHPLSRLRWLRAHEPGALARTRAVVDPKDFLAARLTGRVATDTVTGSRLAGHAPEAERLPPLAVLGPMRAGLPGALAGLAGRPVVMAAHDSWASVIGLGAMRPGGAYLLSGSTDVTGVLTAERPTSRPPEAPGLLTDRWHGVWHLGGPSNAGGDSLAWLLGLLAPGEPPGPALDRLLAAPRRAERAVFLPYLDGERTPYWDAGLRGAFAGLHRSHGPADLLWAVMEGVACLNRTVLDRAQAACGPVAALRAGGGAAVPTWLQVRADVLQRPVLAVAERECGLLGAAVAAWTALGRFPDLIAAQDACVRVSARYDPAAEEDDTLARFRAVEAASATSWRPGRGTA